MVRGHIVRTLFNAGLCAVLVASFVAGPLSQAASAQASSTRVAQATSTGTLSGTVTDNRNAPQSGATVTATGPGGTQTATTDANGAFSLPLAPGLWNVTVSKGGFQAYETDNIGVVAGSTTNLTISMTPLQLSTLHVIGSVTSTATNTINNRPDAVTTLNQQDIYARAQPNLNEQIGELPGVYIARGTGTTPNTNWIIRGQAVETKVEFDGHPLSSGVFGDYTSQFANSALFQQVEVVEGVGLNGPNAGEAPVGIVNLRTRDFTKTNQAYVAGALDSYGGSYYNLWASGNALKNNRFSYVLAKSMDGVRGPGYGVWSNVLNAGATTSTTFSLNPAFNQTALIKWQGDMGYPFVTAGELFKARYSFSDSTSLMLQFLGIHGKWVQQGGSYASNNGLRIVAPCFTQGATAPTPNAAGLYTFPGSYSSNLNAANCNASSEYNPPYASGLIGSNAQFYGWFPSSVVQDNEPYWSAEFRTTLKNDTILIRPYAAMINRFISGAVENQYPGNFGGWFQVTNAANCQTAFVPPNATVGGAGAGNGAKGPCFPNNMSSPTQVPFINATANVPVFPFSTNAISCSAATPCWTTPTEPENNGLWGYGTPFSQPELDRLRGITFQYIHPVGNNLYGFSYDWNKDDTSKLAADTTIVPAGCTPTVAGGQSIPNVASQGIAYQPACPLPFLPGNDINIPSTQIQHGDFALTGLLQLGHKLQSSIGLYYTTWNANYQIENPATLLAYASVPVGGASTAPVDFLKQTRSFGHFDPQVGFTYRPNTNIALRASYGSGITVPYAGQISGLANLTLANAADGFTFTYQTPNANLQPESTVALDLGGDLRLPDGGIMSIDGFDNTTHNAWMTSNVPGAPPPNSSIPGCAAPALTCQTAETFNGPVWYNYGVELTFQKNNPIGLGYFVTTTIQRSYYNQLPSFLFVSGSNLIDWKQIDGGGTFFSVPYWKSYGELRYGLAGGGRISVGADYQGSNNQTYGPAFVVFNASARVPFGNGWAVQVAVDNFTDVNSGTYIGQGTFNNGFAVTRLQIKNGTTNIWSSSPTSIQTIPPPMASLELSKSFGY
jgi:outer membrane receptor protein involved in Fe transport